jgi:hypothetical protein
MSIVKISCVDAANAVPQEFPNMDTSVIRPVDIASMYGMVRKAKLGKIWKMIKVARKTVFNQTDTFDGIGIKEDVLAVMAEV